MNDPNSIGRLLFEHGLRKAWEFELAQWMVNSFREAWLRRYCQLCEKEYTAEPPPSDQTTDNRPRICPDCLDGIEHVAAATANRTGVPITNELATLLTSRYITRQPFQYGRPWQDHVPTHQRHLIGETP